MADFHSLPVYKAALELEHQFSASTQKTPRILKYGKVDLLHKEIIELIVKVAFANEYTSNRLEILDDSLEMMRRIKIQARILLDLRAITRNGFAAIVLAEENLNRQLCGWKNSVIKKKKESNGI